jgi:hypothetical protein
MLRIVKQAGVATLLVALVGCGTSPTAPRLYEPPVFEAEDSVFTDDELRAAFFSSYEGPPGFYAEAHDGSAPYYVNTWSIHSPYDRSYRPRFELSTEDSVQARQWADSTVAYSIGVAPLDSSPPAVTDRYFEFHTISGPPSTTLRLRIHRATYFDRSTEGPRGPDWGVGALQVRPIDASAARGLAEYLTFLEFYSTRAKPLSSFARKEGAVVHVIFWVGSGDFGVGPETIRLWRDEYRVYSDSGDTVRRREMVRSIPAIP